VTVTPVSATYGLLSTTVHRDGATEFGLTQGRAHSVATGGRQMASRYSALSAEQLDSMIATEEAHLRRSGGRGRRVRGPKDKPFHEQGTWQGLNPLKQDQCIKMQLALGSFILAWVRSHPTAPRRCSAAPL
jgi:hypothetical protein